MGSNVAPDHVAPPNSPGIWIVPSALGGMNSGPYRIVLIFWRTNSWASGEISVMSLSVKPCRTNGGGFTGAIWLAAVRSPGISDAAAGFAAPCTYSVDGKQYVVIAAGGGGKSNTKMSDTYVAFALPK